MMVESTAHNWDHKLVGKLEFLMVHWMVVCWDNKMVVTTVASRVAVMVVLLAS
jgi:hypothetical protein